MPGMVLCGRRWSIGSDDLLLPAIFLAISSAVWLILLASMAPGFQDSAAARGTEVPKRFWALVIVHLFGMGACLVIEIAMVVFSLRGYITYPQPRWPMQYLIYTRLVLFILQLITAFVAIVWINRHGLALSSARTLTGIVIFELILLSIILLITWDQAGKKFVKEHKRKKQYAKLEEAYQSSWEKRCRLLCCCISYKKENSDSFRDVAKFFSNLFEGEDIVPTDVLAGLVLLNGRQREDLEKMLAEGKCSAIKSFTPVTNDMQLLDLSRPDTRKLLAEMRHCMGYCWGSYGWPHYLMFNPCTNYPRWLKGLNPCSCRPALSEDTIVEGCDCCMCNFSALISTLPEGVDTELTFITDHSKIGETPFLIACDHTIKAIVVCCRGTRSLEDAVTDVLCKPALIPLNEINTSFFAHQGCANAGAFMYHRIMQDQLVEKAQAKRRTEEPYRVLVVGHSLGGGTAPLLAILMHQSYPDLQCYAFSPPGALVSEPVIKHTESYITTFLAGEDVIPSIGLPQLNKFRDDLVRELNKTDLAKWTVIIKGTVKCLGEPTSSEGAEAADNADGEVENLDEVAMDNAHHTRSSHHSVRKGMRLHALAYLKDPSQMDSESRVQPPSQMYLPGRLIHALKNASGDYSFYRTNNLTSLQEIKVTKNMVTDHRGDTVLESLKLE